MMLRSAAPLAAGGGVVGELHPWQKSRYSPIPICYGCVAPSKSYRYQNFDSYSL
jgi:hypothetical protein